MSPLSAFWVLMWRATATRPVATIAKEHPMSNQIKAEFTISNWDEQPFDEGVGVAKLTRASVTKEYSGDVDGTSTTEWLMVYAPDKSATFVGIERIRGVVA
ncbi:MAG: hypothetical protein JWN39_3876, partial [Ilumatobacteraceae bacterium]|nr:hypothetical protein [Ilumatobacteraceae bacterium]